MVRALSTAVCALPASPRVLLERWRTLAGERIGLLAVDTRLGPELQGELLREAQAAGLECSEVAHSSLSRDRRRAASPISADRDERTAAVEQIRLTLRLAAETGAQRVLLMPGKLPLSVSRASLAWRFSLGRSATTASLAEERAALARPALDHLSLVLDDLLPSCAQLQLTLVLPVPPPWPDQVPGLAEAGALIDLFRGAPIGLCFASDWAAGAAALAGEPMPRARSVERGLCSLRLADACGLRQRLAPGVGEIAFDRVLEGAGELDQVLAPGPEVRGEEIARAVDLLNHPTRG